jgi:uncharacterized protein YbjQ (UPF0145 family)
LESARLLEEQSALRRVAMLVARSVPPSAVFQAVTRKVGLLCGADLARMERYEQDGSVSEALTNMTKHAEASQAQVRVEQHDSTLRLCVGDDGVGGAEPQRGSGLLGLRDRVEALGGLIDVTSPVGHGTVIQVSLPIERTDGACPPESP